MATVLSIKTAVLLVFLRRMTGIGETKAIQLCYCSQKFVLCETGAAG